MRLSDRSFDLQFIRKGLIEKTNQIIEIDSKYRLVKNLSSIYALSMALSQHPDQIQDLIIYRIDATHNMARFYRLTVELSLFGEYVVVRQFGRIGHGGNFKREFFLTREEAEAQKSRLAARKIKRGYQTSRRFDKK